ncbi:hypothetical protein J6590_074268 [Homalodisca vitripennis]|nr:hypothetical protein J6590_074268 [Homalodisca vitripennis]
MNVNGHLRMSCKSACRSLAESSDRQLRISGWSRMRSRRYLEQLWRSGFYPTFARAGVMRDCVSLTHDLWSGLAFSAVTSGLDSKQISGMFEPFTLASFFTPFSIFVHTKTSRT